MDKFLKKSIETSIKQLKFTLNIISPIIDFDLLNVQVFYNLFIVILYINVVASA